MIAAMARACSTGPDADEREGVLSDSSAASSGSLQNPMVSQFIPTRQVVKSAIMAQHRSQTRPNQKKRHSPRAAYCACISIVIKYCGVVIFANAQENLIEHEGGSAPPATHQQREADSDEIILMGR